MEALYIKLAIEIVLMLASKHPEVLLDIITKVGQYAPELLVEINKVLSKIEIKPPQIDPNPPG